MSPSTSELADPARYGAVVGVATVYSLVSVVLSFLPLTILLSLFSILHSQTVLVN